MVSDSSAPIDLHIHTTASDGSLPPSEIIQAARRLGLGAIAITDHDTLAGTKDALHAGIPPGLKFVPGVELSANPPAGFSISGSMHLLGYNIRLDNSELNNELKKLQEARANRNPEIVRRLNALGLKVSYDTLAASCDGQLSRPHIAAYMLNKGYVSSIDDAFDTYLSQGKPAYVSKYRIDWRRAITMVRNAGGVAVLAHPCLLDLPDTDTLEKLLVLLKSAGLGGIEAYYSEHTPEQTNRFKALAKKHALLITGGSDFHGTINPHIEMGRGRGDLFIPYSIYETLVQAS